MARLEGIIKPLLLEEPKREIEKVIYQGESAGVIIGYDSRAAVKYLPLLKKVLRFPIKEKKRRARPRKNMNPANRLQEKR